VTAYANVLTSRVKAIDVVSNQYLFDDPVEFAYMANNYHLIDDATASAGASYKWENTLVKSRRHFRQRSAEWFRQLIPNLSDKNRCAQSRRPMDMIFQGISTSLFHA
jgi:hypothetical protein